MTDKDKAVEAKKDAVKQSMEKEKKQAERVEKAQEPDKVEGQQTGESHYVTTKADVHVEPARAEVLAAKAGKKAPAKVIGTHEKIDEKVDYASKAELEVPAAEEKQDEGTLAGYVAAMQQKANDRGVIVTAVSYPGASEGVFEGRFGGVRVTDGTKGAKFSDGKDAEGK